jgi:polar amino acid transport system substrate-binding protein
MSWERVKAGKELIVGIKADYPPMEFIDLRDGELVGFDVDFARELEGELGLAECRFVKLDLKVWDWPTVVQRLNSGEFDVVISGVMITDGRKQDVNFIEYHQPKHYLVYRAENDFSTISKLPPMATVAVPKGTGTEDLAREIKRELKLRWDIQDEEGNEAPFESVEQGKADATMAHLPVARWYAERKRLKVSEEPVKWAVAEAIGIAFRKQDQALMKEIERVVKQLNQKQYIDRFNHPFRRAEERALRILDDKVVYPEGAAHIGGKLYYVGYGDDTVCTWDGKSRHLLRQLDAGSGPTAIVPVGKDELLVACYEKNLLVRLDQRGETVGKPIEVARPNDFVKDSKGNVYASS